jgi:hypothetical protein
MKKIVFKTLQDFQDCETLLTDAIKGGEDGVIGEEDILDG